MKKLTSLRKLKVPAKPAAKAEVKPVTKAVAKLPKKSKQVGNAILKTTNVKTGVITETNGFDLEFLTNWVAHAIEQGAGKVLNYEVVAA